MSNNSLIQHPKARRSTEVNPLSSESVSIHHIPNRIPLYHMFMLLPTCHRFLTFTHMRPLSYYEVSQVFILYSRASTSLNLLQYSLHLRYQHVYLSNNLSNKSPCIFQINKPQYRKLWEGKKASIDISNNPVHPLKFAFHSSHTITLLLFFFNTRWLLSKPLSCKTFYFQLQGDVEKHESCTSQAPSLRAWISENI